jgi:LPXTG-motif cell wall-anchored protein
MKTLLSKVMLMAVMAALMTFAAGTTAQAEEKQISPDDILKVPEDLPSSPSQPPIDLETNLCDKYPGLCDQTADPVLDPVLEPKGPKICQLYPEICGGPKDPVLDPTNPPEPPKPEECKDDQVKDKDGKCVPKPPEECKYGQVKDKDGKCTDGNDDKDTGNNGTGGGYGSGGSNSGGGYGGDGYGGGIVYRGTTYINSFLPSGFATRMENAGNAVKSSLPAPVAKTLPNTGGGWTSLALAGGALLLAGRFLIRRFSN